jgi:hypothetical protein
MATDFEPKQDFDNGAVAVDTDAASNGKDSNADAGDAVVVDSKDADCRQPSSNGNGEATSEDPAPARDESGAEDSMDAAEPANGVRLDDRVEAEGREDGEDLEDGEIDDDEEEEDVKPIPVDDYQLVYFGAKCEDT